MKEIEYDHLAEEELGLPLLNTVPRRRTSASKHFNALKRMTSVLHRSDPAPGLGEKPVKTVASKTEQPASLYRVPEHPAYPASGSRRNTNVPITNLMAPIQPGQQVPRGYMPRSSTTGSFTDAVPYGRSIGNFLNTSSVPGPNFMRSTSSSAARQVSAIPTPTGMTSSRRPSIEQSNVQRSTQSRVQPGRYRQSLPVRSLPIQPEKGSDLPFRNLYESGLHFEQENTGATSHLPRVTDSQSSRRDSDSEEETLTLTKPLEIPRTPQSELDDAYYVKQLEAYREYLVAPEPDLTGEMKPEPELDDQHHVHFEDQRTPTQGTFQRESEPDGSTKFDFSDQQTPTQGNIIQRGSEYGGPTGFNFSDQQTPTQQIVDSGNEVATQNPSRRDDDRFRRLPDLGDTVDWSASLSDNQRGKQPAHGKQAVRMAISDVDRPKYEAIAKEQESHKSSEGDTVIRRGEEDNGQEEDNIRNIYHPMPTSYWSGRFTSASDRFRGEALAAQPRRPEHPMMNDGIRLRRVLNELDSCCKTIEARRSLFAYWKAYAHTYGWPRPSELMSFGQIAVAATGHVPAPAPEPKPEQPAEDGSGKKKKKGGVLGRLGSMSFRRKSGN